MNKGLEILSAIILFGVLLFTICFYTRIPMIIPIHYDLFNNANGFGSKSSIWLVVVIELFTYIGMSFLQKFPQKFNYPVQVTESNKERLFFLGVRVMLVMKLCMVILYSCILLSMVTTFSRIMNWMENVIIIMVVVIPIIYIVKMNKCK